ncbi:MAG: EFR1 family ferrodoxin [Clostridiales bacterium]|nr:EFR1 family ferrodoxin [Clostridiales bacterium]
MIGVYFSGTGNTKHCVEYFLNRFDGGRAYAIESEGVTAAIQSSDEIVFAYPVYYSNLPKIVREFIVSNAELWRGKKIFIIATMGLFSGDGAGCSARLFTKYGAKILGGLHLKMPDCIGDVKLLKKSLDENRKIIIQAERKMDATVKEIKDGKYPKEGLNLFYHVAGLFGQRLYFRGKTKRYYTKIKTDDSKCVKCGLCVSLCPMSNIAMEDKVVYRDKCTMCYRCFANCPKQAITIIGKQVYEQCKFENYKE